VRCLGHRAVLAAAAAVGLIGPGSVVSAGAGIPAAAAVWCRTPPCRPGRCCSSTGR
jgi:hypothetical protein